MTRNGHGEARKHFSESRVISDLRVRSLAGSLRRASLHRGLVCTVREFGFEDVAVEPYEKLGEIPFFGRDVEGEQRTRTRHPEYTLSGETRKGNLK